MASMQQSMMSAPASAHLQTTVPHLTWTVANPWCSYLVVKELEMHGMYAHSGKTEQGRVKKFVGSARELCGDASAGEILTECTCMGLGMKLKRCGPSHV